jgi:hypothetical protein
MKRLAAIALLFAAAGCGTNTPPIDGATPTPPPTVTELATKGPEPASDDLTGKSVADIVIVERSASTIPGLMDRNLTFHLCDAGVTMVQGPAVPGLIRIVCAISPQHGTMPTQAPAVGTTARVALLPYKPSETGVENLYAALPVVIGGGPSSLTTETPTNPFGTPIPIESIP